MMIETDRLILREMKEDDDEALSKVLQDESIMQHYPYTFDKAKVKAWIARNIQRYEILVLDFGQYALKKLVK